MRRKLYLNYVLYALISCCFVVGYAYIRGESFQWLGLVISFIFGILFMTFVIVRLPIFNQYYAQSAYPRNLIIPTKPMNRANQRAAPVMSSLLTGVVLGVTFYSFGVEQFKVECFVGAITSGVMSFYFEPKV